jgi:hypothetical protein
MPWHGHEKKCDKVHFSTVLSTNWYQKYMEHSIRVLFLPRRTVCSTAQTMLEGAINETSPLRVRQELPTAESA